MKDVAIAPPPMVEWVSDRVGLPPRLRAIYKNQEGRRYFMYFDTALDAVIAFQTMLIEARLHAQEELAKQYPVESGK